MLSSKLLLQSPSVVKIHGENLEVELVISTDSRTVKVGDTFVALHGEKFDGFDYVEQVLKLGARVIIYSQKRIVKRR